MLRFRSLSALWVMILTLFAITSPARAITYGYPTGSSFGNVGAFIVKAPDGQILPVSSGTLIAPTVFLTAGHSTSFFNSVLASQGYKVYVSFDSSIPFGNLTSPGTNLIPAVGVVTHPNFNRSQSDPADMGVLILPAGSTAGIIPALLPTAGLLDQLKSRNGLKDAVFTPVGYGVQNRVVGGGPPFFLDANPVPRMYALSSYNALSPGYLRLSQNPSTGNGGTCYGDSGGPNFLQLNGQRILAATTITGDTVCGSTNVTYRLDTATARQFLALFVTLP
jgi:hypothetical protein